MEEVLRAAFIESVVLPLVASLALTGALRFGLGRARGAALASLSIAAAFLFAYAAILTWPGFPPVSSGQKIAYIVLFGLLGGAAIDLAARPPWLERTVVVLWPAVIVAWIAWPRLTSPTPEILMTSAVLWVVGLFVLDRLRAGRAPAATAAVVLLASAVGASLVAFLGAAELYAQLLGGLAAATGGFLLWNWPVPRYPFGEAAVLGAGGAFLSSVTILVLFSDISILALAFVLPVFGVPLLVQRLPLARKRMLAPVVLGAICLIPVTVAVGIAFSSNEGVFELIESESTHS